MVLAYTYHGIFVWLPRFYVDILNLTDVRAIWFVLVVTVFQIPGYYSATFFLDKIGRKPTLISYLVMAGVGSGLLGFARDTTSILIWSCVISFFSLGEPLHVYSRALSNQD
jgi:putative MFS transporter